MLRINFESRERCARDKTEINVMQTNYGEKTVSVLEHRSHDNNLSPRSRRHWKRLLRKARKISA